MSLFFIRALIAFVIVSAVYCGSPTSKSLTTSLKDSSVEGLEDLNVKIAFPFKFHDYTVGFKHSLKNLMDTPESVFVKRTFDTVQDTKTTVDVEYNTVAKTVAVGVKTAFEKLGLSVFVNGCNKDKIKNVGVDSTQEIDGRTVDLNLGYDVSSKKISVKGSVAVDDATASLKVDSEARDPELSVVYSVDDSNSVKPTVSLKTGAFTYGWTRKWNGGSLETTLYPGDKVTLDWNDNGTNGVWKTKAVVPLDDAQSAKISVARDWKL